MSSPKDFPIYKTSPLHAGLLDFALNGTAPGWPDVAVTETQAECQGIYDKYK